MKLAIFSSLVHSVNLILHILIELNGVHDLAMSSHMLDHSKNQKNALLNDPKSQKRGFWPFSGLTSVGLT